MNDIKTETTQLNVHDIPVDLKRRLKSICAMLGMPVNKKVLELVKDFVEKEAELNAAANK